MTAQAKHPPCVINLEIFRKDLDAATENVELVTKKIAALQRVLHVAMMTLDNAENAYQNARANQHKVIRSYRLRTKPAKADTRPTVTELSKEPPTVAGSLVAMLLMGGK